MRLNDGRVMPSNFTDFSLRLPRGVSSGPVVARLAGMANEREREYDIYNMLICRASDASVCPVARRDDCDIWRLHAVGHMARGTLAARASGLSCGNCKLWSRQLGRVGW